MHDTLSAARAHVQAHRTDLERGVLVTADRQSFADYSARWLATRARRVRPVTLTGYRTAARPAVPVPVPSRKLGNITKEGSPPWLSTRKARTTSKRRSASGTSRRATPCTVAINGSSDPDFAPNGMHLQVRRGSRVLPHAKAEIH